jgi:benzodiazapine receptor
MWDNIFMKPADIIKLIISCGLCLAVGLVGSFFTNSLSGWYQNLQKPPFNPPSWVFAPVWTILYLLMGVSAFLVWRSGPVTTAVKFALTCFLVQLAFNALWTPLFFLLRTPLAALVDIILLWFAIVATIISFHKVSTPAAILLAPYIIWVSFAAVLNAAICILNR